MQKTPRFSDVLYFSVIAIEPYAVFTISLKSQAHENDEEEGEGNTVMTLSFRTDIKV